MGLDMQGFIYNFPKFVKPHFKCPITISWTHRNIFTTTSMSVS